MPIRSLGRALTCFAALLVLLGATASSPSVTVADGALTPRVVVIPAGGSVLWTNRGTRQHAIVAQRSAFPALRLAPGGARRVAFARPGRYPYLLDGVVNGMVFVTASSGPIGASGPGTGPSSAGAGCDHPTIYRYDVRVAVHREATGSGVLSTTTLSDWKASWVAPMRVGHSGVCGDWAITIAQTAPGVDVLHGGQSDITYTWTQGDCHFSVARKFAAKMAIQDGISLRVDRTAGTFDLFFEIEDGGGLGTAMTDAKHQACDDKAMAAYHLPVYGDVTVNGVRVTASDTNLVLFFAMPPRTAVGAAILSALASGKGFNFDSGEQVTPGESLTSRVRATVSFSRL
jgi:hypothetical protein